MAEPGSALPGGFVLGALSHADRIGLIYDARGPGGRAASALVLHPLHVDELSGWFTENAALGISLRHPNLVEVFAAGETHNGLPVMVTERVEGRTLRARIAAQDLLMGAELQRLVRSIAGALDYLHGQSPPVLHRALIPEHVVTTLDGGLKLLAVGHADRPHHAPAKPSYLSPEELRGHRLSPASDVFSLASLAFEVLTGRPAFPGDAGAVMAAVQRAALPWVGVVSSEALAPLNRTLHRAWSLDPRDRPQRAGLFAQELDEALRLVPSSLLAVRRSPREVPASSRPPPSSVRPLRAQTAPSGYPAAIAARSLTPPVGRVLTPMPARPSNHPSAVPAAARSASGAWAIPAAPRVPTGLTVVETSAEPAMPIALVSERQRSVTPPAPLAPPPSPPAADEMPARLRVDTDDAVLIMEPSLIEDRAVLDALGDDLPLPPRVEAPEERDDEGDDDAPEVSFGDDLARVQVIQKLVVFEAHPSILPPAPTSTVELSPSLAPPEPAPLALTSRSTPVSGPSIFDRSPTALARSDEDRRPSWTRWRPRLSPLPPKQTWDAREIRFTPRLLAAIVLGNVALTALIVWGVIALTRR